MLCCKYCMFLNGKYKTRPTTILHRRRSNITEGNSSFVTFDYPRIHEYVYCKISNTKERALPPFPNTEKRVENTTLMQRSIFDELRGVQCGPTLHWVFDISSQSNLNLSGKRRKKSTRPAAAWFQMLFSRLETWWNPRTRFWNNTYNIITLSSKQKMSVLSWYTTKFSELAFKEMYGEVVQRFCILRMLHFKFVFLLDSSLVSSRTA